MTWITTTDFLYLILFAIVHTVISIPLHEAGHLVCGLATGYRFGSFNIFSFVWARQDGKLTFSRNKNSLIAGQCLMRPPEEEKDFAYWLYNAGGGLFNLLAAILMLPGLWAPGRILYLFCLMGVAVEGAQALVNLIPMDLGIPNDGLNIWKASRSALAKHGFFLMLKTHDEMLDGKRYRDYPEEAFEVDGPVNSKNYFEYYILMLQAARYADLGEHDKVLQVYEPLDVPSMKGYYATLINIDMLYEYTMYSKDYDKARNIFSLKKVQQLLKNKLVMFMRVRAAYLFFVLNMQEPARELLEKARAALEEQTSLGAKMMEGEALDELAEAMDASEQTSLDEAAPAADGPEENGAEDEDAPEEAEKSTEDAP